MGPDQRFLGVLDTSPFRIAIVYSIVFACGAAALLGAVDFAVSRVVDGSTDGSADELHRIKDSDPNVRVIRLAKNTGQTAALQCGFSNSLGDVVVALDGDGENDPADIPPLVSKLKEGYDLVSGWRTARWQNETFTRRLPSVAANRLISRITGTRLHDYGCTLKAYRGDLARIGHLQLRERVAKGAQLLR